MADYFCPKCDGSDYYWGKNLKADGWGGVVEGPESMCRKCDVSMLVIESSAEKVENALRIGGALIVLVGCVVVFSMFLEM